MISDTSKHLATSTAYHFACIRVLSLFYMYPPNNSYSSMSCYRQTGVIQRTTELELLYTHRRNPPFSQTQFSTWRVLLLRVATHSDCTSRINANKKACRVRDTFAIMCESVRKFVTLFRPGLLLTAGLTCHQPSVVGAPPGEHSHSGVSGRRRYGMFCSSLVRQPYQCTKE